MSAPCRSCGKQTTQAGDGWDGMCPECADTEHAKDHVDPSDFGDAHVDVLEDDADAYGADPGQVFSGVLHMLGTYGHVTLIECTWELSLPEDGQHGVRAVAPALQRLVDAAMESDVDVFIKEQAQPKWVKLAAWPGRLYLLTFAPGSA